jgi:hypothetical protein
MDSNPLKFDDIVSNQLKSYEKSYESTAQLSFLNWEEYPSLNLGVLDPTSATTQGICTAYNHPSLNPVAYVRVTR